MGLGVWECDGKRVSESGGVIGCEYECGEFDGEPMGECGIVIGGGV